MRLRPHSGRVALIAALVALIGLPNRSLDGAKRKREACYLQRDTLDSLRSIAATGDSASTH